MPHQGAWRYRSRTAGELTVQCPAIVSVELWNTVQAVRAEHAARSKRNRKENAPYLLVGGRCRCATCGLAMTPYTQTKPSGLTYIRSG
jgi:hypothetical protein